MHELLLAIVAGVDLSTRPELGVGTKDEVHPGGRPLEFVGLAISALKHVLSLRDRIPLDAKIKQIHEEVVRQRLWPMGENAMLIPAVVGSQNP